MSEKTKDEREACIESELKKNHAKREKCKMVREFLLENAEKIAVLVHDLDELIGLYGKEYLDQPTRDYLPDNPLIPAYQLVMQRAMDMRMNTHVAMKDPKMENLNRILAECPESIG